MWICLLDFMWRLFLWILNIISVAASWLAILVLEPLCSSVAKTLAHFFGRWDLQILKWFVLPTQIRRIVHYEFREFLKRSIFWNRLLLLSLLKFLFL